MTNGIIQGHTDLKLAGMPKRFHVDHWHLSPKMLSKFKLLKTSWSWTVDDSLGWGQLTYHVHGAAISATAGLLVQQARNFFNSVLAVALYWIGFVAQAMTRLVFRSECRHVLTIIKIVETCWHSLLIARVTKLIYQSATASAEFI